MRRGGGPASDRLRGRPRDRCAHLQAAEKVRGKDLAHPLKDPRIVRPNATEVCHPIVEDGHCRRILKGWRCGNHCFGDHRSLAAGPAFRRGTTPRVKAKCPPAALCWPTRRAHLCADRSATRAMTRQRRIPTLPRPDPAEPFARPDHGPSSPPAARPERRVIRLPRVRHRSEPDHEAIRSLSQAVLATRAQCHEAAIIKDEGAILYATG